MSFLIVLFLKPVKVSKNHSHSFRQFISSIFKATNIVFHSIAVTNLCKSIHCALNFQS